MLITLLVGDASFDPASTPIQLGRAPDQCGHVPQGRRLEPARRSNGQRCRIVEVRLDHAAAIEDAVRRVKKALGKIRYGEIVVKAANNKPIWVDKYERERVG